MRRAVLALGGTVAGLILLLSFRSHTAAPAAAGVSAGGSDSMPASPPAMAAPTTAAPMPGATKAKPTAMAGGGTGMTAPKVVTGDVINSPYGPSQVAVTLSAGKITKVTILQHTDDGEMSQEIDGPALPKLVNETLAAQSAMIDAVSGASYTSAGYIKSLQSALDKAKA
jgi:uncharacterized protein with FMN-binding domain